MHHILKKQLSQLALDKDTLPSGEEQWHTFLQEVELTYAEADEGLSTPKCSGDISGGLEQHDVTERKVSEQKFATLASFPDENDQPVLRIDNQGVVEYSNTAAIDILKIWDVNVGDRVNGELAETIKRVYVKKAQESHEFVVGDKTYMLRFVPVHKSGYVNIYGSDHTVQKLFEHDLIAARDLAEESSKSKSQFLAMMSHEIRTPMNGVMGMTELLLHSKLGDTQKHYANNIMKSAHVLLRIIDDVLDISKIEANKLVLETAEFNLSNLMQEIESSFGATLDGENLQLQIILSPDLPRTIIGDSGRLRQILVNIIGNAVKFTKEGEIKVSVSEVAGAAEDVNLHVEVLDTGIGMDEETCSRIFASFSQADQSTTRIYGGTGLGLAIVKRLVSMMDGDIGVISELGKGSCFWFDLKLQRVSMGASVAYMHDADHDSCANDVCQNSVKENKKQEDQSSTAGMKVLLAEDNLMNQEVAMYMLEDLGCQVDVVSNGLEALNAIKANKYSMVLMDCRMPEMDGYEATRCIRKFEHESGCVTPVLIVALTANAMLSDIDECKKAGMDEFISKPFSISDLRSVVNF